LERTVELKWKETNRIFKMQLSDDFQQLQLSNSKVQRQYKYAREYLNYWRQNHPEQESFPLTVDMNGEATLNSTTHRLPIQMVKLILESSMN
jgi:hypothetical protein